MKPIYAVTPDNGWYNTTIANPIGFASDMSLITKDVEFFPWKGASKSNVSSFDMLPWPVNHFYKTSDNDPSSLEKFMYNSPALVDYVKNRGLTGRENDDRGWNDALNHYKLNGTMERIYSSLNIVNEIGMTSLGLEMLSIGIGKMSSGFGDLTISEVNKIQAIVNKAGKPLDVVGSAARGARKAASDIDYLVNPSDAGAFEGLSGQLPKIDRSHGLLRNIHRPSGGPAIRFSPGTIEPTVVPGASVLDPYWTK